MNKDTYHFTITKGDKIVADADIDSWTVIRFLVTILNNLEGEKSTDDATEKPVKKPGKRVRHCGQCGRPGHTYQTCTKQVGAPKDEDDYIIAEDTKEVIRDLRG